MNANISTTGQWAAAWLMVGVLTAPGAHPGSAFLPLTGPTPLRFEVAFVKPMAPAPIPLEKAEEKNPVATETVFTNAPSEIHYSVGPTNDPPVTPEESETSYPSVIHSLTDRPLIVTPQMLAEYFKPAANGTNAAGVSVFLPVSVSFKPPTDTVPVRSRATYKTE